MTDTTQQPDERLAHWVFGALKQWAPPLDVVDHMLNDLGIDPDMTHERLREDLAIAERARRAASPAELVPSAPHQGDWWNNGWRACLSFILGAAGRSVPGGETR